MRELSGSLDRSRPRPLAFLIASGFPFFVRFRECFEGREGRARSVDASAHSIDNESNFSWPKEQAGPRVVEALP